MLTAYVRAFEAQQAAEVAPFHDLPCTFIRPDGLWIVQDAATALVLAEHLIEQAQAQGGRRTEISALTVRTLARGLAELSHEAPNPMPRPAALPALAAGGRPGASWAAPEARRRVDQGVCR